VPRSSRRSRPRIWGGQLGAPFVKAKQAADLSPYYQKFGWDSKMPTTAIEGMTFDGVKAGVPFLLAGIGGWYNQAIFKIAGVSGPPQSYAELEEMNDKIRASGVIPLATAGKYGWHIMRLYEYLLETSAGPELHDKLLTGQETWDRPEVVTAFTNFKKWQEKKWIPDGAIGLDPSDVENWYVQGKAAYTITGSWTEPAGIQAADKKSSDFGVFQFPTGQDPKRHSGFVEGYMMNAKSGNPDKAAALIDFLVQPDSQKAMKYGNSAVTGAEPDKATLPLSYEWTQGPGKQPFYTIQDQAFPRRWPTNTSRSRVTCCRARSLPKRLPNRCRAQCQPGRRADQRWVRQLSRRLPPRRLSSAAGAKSTAA
jgi:raffinose/stachyose/melibiose transport system substrate-binding protein